MSDPQPVEPKSRPVGGTENSWCRAVPIGTGTTVLALRLSKPPDTPLLQTALRRLQTSHPILRSTLHLDPTTATFSFATPLTPRLRIQHFDLHSTARILQSPSIDTLSPFHHILEHEMNLNPWSDSNGPTSDVDLFFASVYEVSADTWAVVLRVHTAACDRTAAVALLRELLELMVEGGGAEGESNGEAEVSLGIESYIPSGKADKRFWARGVDMLGYSLNSFRLANLSFEDTGFPRKSEVVRLELNADETDRIVSGCKSRGIKLCALVAAAGLLAARSSKCLPYGQWEKYAVATLIDCRSVLDPILSCHHQGFYHSALVNSHDLKGGEELWELAKRIYTSFANAKDNNKHFSDMADLNFLMCKAIDNPGLTPSSSLRTSLISVFEDPVIDDSNILDEGVGVEDYVGCASVHGVGPSIAVFDTIRDGKLDCACVYPSPLHSREQMQDIVDDMKRFLVDGGGSLENDR
ncbi:hypothetical protein RJ639_016023 [Escallonia herrerae]|uniref:Phthiocerol/phthiodiolone dimycocerosyl transferase C-terminal domain-containing protein n=1 Tax=Escallonia herrerae TaxID=1293975 RepID=A0AA89AKR9_9ASTE|nr:hypothetical protein RJ639_016023 [Escallonia herrerae]